MFFFYVSKSFIHVFCCRSGASCAEELVSLTELDVLVEKLDATKTGILETNVS